MRVARCPVDMNEVARVDRPVMNNPCLTETVKGFAQLLPEAAQRSVRAAAPRADRLDAGGEVLGVAFEPKLQPARQILLAELLAGLPVVQGVAVRREQRRRGAD